MTRRRAAEQPTDEERAFARKMMELKRTNRPAYNAFAAYIDLAGRLHQIGDRDGLERLAVWVERNPLTGGTRSHRDLTCALRTGAWRDEVRSVHSARVLRLAGPETIQ
jgi:hypothetical protein